MNKGWPRVVLGISIVLMTLAGAAVLRADVTGSILGVVHDRSQAVISGARIVVTNVQTNFKQDATSGADGSYHLLALPAGNYQLSVTAAGFRAFTEKDIVVKVNDELRFDVTLDVGNVTETVEITANAVQVQTENTSWATLSNRRRCSLCP